MGQYPWVIGYSGGKDSSAVMQLVWMALRGLPPDKRTKDVHVISTDTLVEQPVVASWVEASHSKMRTEARNAAASDSSAQADARFVGQFLGEPHRARVSGTTEEVSLVHERMKIKPSNKFIREMVRQYGEAVLVLGTRKAESQRRAITMQRHEKHRFASDFRRTRAYRIRWCTRRSKIGRTTMFGCF